MSLWIPLCMLLPCYYSFVLPILEYCSPVWGSAAECHLQLLERQVYSVARLCPDQAFLSLCHRRHFAALCMLYKVNSNLNSCLFSELLSASVRVRHTRDTAAAHPLEFEVSRCRTSQFARCFLPAQTRVWNDLPYTVFDTGMLGGFTGGGGDGEARVVSNHTIVISCFPEFVFQIFGRSGASGVV